jgi:hypothetical protein
VKANGCPHGDLDAAADIAAGDPLREVYGLVA